MTIRGRDSAHYREAQRIEGKARRDWPLSPDAIDAALKRADELLSRPVDGDAVVKEAIQKVRQRLKVSLPSFQVMDIQYKLWRDSEGDLWAWVWVIVPDATSADELGGDVSHEVSQALFEAFRERTVEHRLNVTPCFSFRTKREQATMIRRERRL